MIPGETRALAGTDAGDPSTEPPLTPGLLVLALLVGVLAGAGAVAFTYLIALVHNLSFYGRLSWHWSSTRFGPPSPWGWGIVLVPALGALLVRRVIGHSEPAAVGGGVTEVLEEIFGRQPRIRPRLAFWRPLATAITLGTGGSAGDEGPAMQFGAAMASMLCRRADFSQHRTLLMACGSGAGIGAMFHAPIGAWLLVLELLLWPWRLRAALVTLMAVAAGSWCAASLDGSAFLLLSPHTPRVSWPQWVPIALFAGALAGATALLFIHSIAWVERLAQALAPRPWQGHVLAMLLLGVIFVTTYHWSGHYYLVAGSYAGSSALLQGQMHGVVLLCTLLVLKIAATALTLGSGGSGGIFSPALFVGAALGSLVATLVQILDPGLNLGALASLCAMAGLVAATSGGTLSAAAMVLEITGNFGLVLPTLLAATSAYLLRRHFLTDSYFTLPLTRAGRGIPENLYRRYLTEKPSAVVDKR